MATGKRFYWIKLRDSFFNGENKNAVDFLMSQKNGANYIVLYQLLCLMTVNTDGVMASSVGEMIIPYDPAKIQRECKWFTLDTVIVALEFFKKLGWVYEQSDGVLRIANFDEIVGSETDWAAKQRRQRALSSGDNVPTNVPEMSPPMSPQEIRDESLDIKNIEFRVQSINSQLPHSVYSASAREETAPPSLLDVHRYMKDELCVECAASEAEKFVAWNAVHDWSCLPNWQAAADLWCARIGERG